MDGTASVLASDPPNGAEEAVTAVDVEELDAAPDAPQVVVHVCLSIIRPPSVRFDPGATTPLAPGLVTLDEVAKILVQHPQVIVEVQGHADSTEVSAKPLSEKRARVAKQELVRRGVEATRLCVRGFGNERPVASNQTAEGRAANRRVEYRILEPEEPCTL